MSTKTAFAIEGMECPNCAMILESMENRLPGIRQVEASYRKARLVVEYDESVVSVTQITAEVERLGYRATPEG